MYEYNLYEYGLCEICDIPAELRPVGEGGKEICMSCGMKNKKETEKRMNSIMPVEYMYVVV